MRGQPPSRKAWNLFSVHDSSATPGGERPGENFPANSHKTLNCATVIDETGLSSLWNEDLNAIKPVHVFISCSIRAEPCSLNQRYYSGQRMQMYFPGWDEFAFVFGHPTAPYLFNLCGYPFVPAENSSHLAT